MTILAWLIPSCLVHWFEGVSLGSVCSVYGLVLAVSCAIERDWFPACRYEHQHRVVNESPLERKACLVGVQFPTPSGWKRVGHEDTLHHWKQHGHDIGTDETRMLYVVVLSLHRYHLLDNSNNPVTGFAKITQITCKSLDRSAAGGQPPHATTLLHLPPTSVWKIDSDVASTIQDSGTDSSIYGTNADTNISDRTIATHDIVSTDYGTAPSPATSTGVLLPTPIDAVGDRPEFVHMAELIPNQLNLAAQAWQGEAFYPVAATRMSTNWTAPDGPHQEFVPEFSPVEQLHHHHQQVHSGFRPRIDFQPLPPQPRFLPDHLMAVYQAFVPRYFAVPNHIFWFMG